MCVVTQGTNNILPVKTFVLTQGTKSILSLKTFVHCITIKTDVDGINYYYKLVIPLLSI